MLAEKKSPCLARERSDLSFTRAGKYFVGLTKEDFIIQVWVFIQAEAACERHDNDVITTATKRHMCVSILPPCGCQWILQMSVFSALSQPRLPVRHSSAEKSWCRHSHQLELTSSHDLSFTFSSLETQTQHRLSEK